MNSRNHRDKIAEELERSVGIGSVGNTKSSHRRKKGPPKRIEEGLDSFVREVLRDRRGMAPDKAPWSFQGRRFPGVVIRRSGGAAVETRCMNIRRALHTAQNADRDAKNADLFYLFALKWPRSGIQLQMETRALRMRWPGDDIARGGSVGTTHLIRGKY